MGPDAFLAIIVTGVLMFMVARWAAGVARRNDPQLASAERRTGLEQALWKVNRTIQICQNELDPNKLRRGNEAFTHFYVAYLHEIARAVSAADGVEFNLALEMPILLEVIRLCGDDGGVTDSEKRLAAILETDHGTRGAAAGRLDGAEAVDAEAEGPYFQRIHDYFNVENHPPAPSDGG